MFDPTETNDEPLELEIDQSNLGENEMCLLFNLLARAVIEPIEKCRYKLMEQFALLADNFTLISKNVAENRLMTKYEMEEILQYITLVSYGVQEFIDQHRDWFSEQNKTAPSAATD